MLCSQLALVKRHETGTDIKPLPCRSWSCEYCAPQRRRQLMALAASGSPNRCLTITVTTKVGVSPADRYQKLHAAWKALTKRLLRQWALPPARRWTLREARHDHIDRAQILSRTSTTPQGAYNKLHYLSFAEATKAGEPHLHILLRCPYVPIHWISEQMNELLQSPIVWIELVRSTAKAVAYVTKYVTKAPAQFGKSRRYWASRGWEVNQGDRPERVKHEPGSIQVVRERWTETRDRILRDGLIPTPLPNGWLRLQTHRQWRDEHHSDTGPPLLNAAFRSSVIIGEYRRDALGAGQAAGTIPVLLGDGENR